MLLRFEMLRTMRFVQDYLLDHPDQLVISGEPLRSVMATRSQRRALDALVSAGCLKTFSSDNEITTIGLGEKGSLYTLERSELWINRLVSFALGVATPLLIQFILRLFS